MEPKKDVYITYPKSGGSKAIGAGDLVIDFFEGTARLPDGEEERLSGKLKDTAFPYAYATVHASQAVVVDMDNQGGWTVNADQIVTFLWIPCKVLTIHAAQATNVRVLGATDPRAGPAVADITAPSPL